MLTWALRGSLCHSVVELSGTFLGADLLLRMHLDGRARTIARITRGPEAKQERQAAGRVAGAE